jgi:hypothetical protein
VRSSVSQASSAWPNRLVLSDTAEVEEQRHQDRSEEPTNEVDHAVLSEHRVVRVTAEVDEPVDQAVTHGLHLDCSINHDLHGGHSGQLVPAEACHRSIHSAQPLFRTHIFLSVRANPSPQHTVGERC